jgi:hypothetical protein
MIAHTIKNDPDFREWGFTKLLNEFEKAEKEILLGIEFDFDIEILHREGIGFYCTPKSGNESHRVWVRLWKDEIAYYVGESIGNAKGGSEIKALPYNGNPLTKFKHLCRIIADEMKY